VVLNGLGVVDAEPGPRWSMESHIGSHAVLCCAAEPVCHSDAFAALCCTVPALCAVHHLLLVWGLGRLCRVLSEGSLFLQPAVLKGGEVLLLVGCVVCGGMHCHGAVYDGMV
jgi:hypothetical protein